jgi:hypothetical protein
MQQCCCKQSLPQTRLTLWLSAGLAPVDIAGLFYVQMTECISNSISALAGPAGPLLLLLLLLFFARIAFTLKAPGSHDGNSEFKMPRVVSCTCLASL